jgi:glyoxylase-like metal-dependent hydrolase (beta-lactamase superfamily II)
MKVIDNVYALDATKGNYAYVIMGKEIVLVDTGRPGQGKGILKELDSMDIKPHEIKHILLTHHDVDHIGNLALLGAETGAKIWASKEDIPYICGEKNREGIKRLVSIIMRVKKPEKINLYPEDQEMGDIKVIPAPGHTPGHVCLLYNDVLFVGDLVRTSKGKVSPMKSIMNWNDSVLKESIAKIDNYDFEWICPAHGEPIKMDGQLKELY